MILCVYSGHRFPLLYMTDVLLFDVLLKVCSKPKVETGHLVLLLNIYVLTGVSLGSSSDLG